MSGAYLRTFTCTKCGRRFKATVGGFMISPREMELMSRPVCDDCKANQMIRMGIKGVDALKKILQRKA